MRSSAEAIAMIIQMDQVPATDAYDTVKSTPSSMDELSVHVL